MSKRACLFCGANTGASATIVEETQALCDLLIAHDYDLVYGGGRDGLMGVIAEQFLKADRQVIGVRPLKLIKEEPPHEAISTLIAVEDMFERKQRMMELSDVFIALPGGIGTLDEIIEAYTHFKLGYTHKFCGILNTGNFYGGLNDLLNHMVEKAFLKQEDKEKLVFSSTPRDLMAAILAF
ncbi:MAG TPA: TIGR00730 family Rossman fold protein [Saprospiraceae bacterium]|nr:TIGR00730 family Rossman fold protein [Saprospiraceae bacterium]HMQ85099.1 TIGR00730 family Rossman fold protein [Saprospiraceae bacterium]